MSPEYSCGIESLAMARCLARSAARIPWVLLAVSLNLVAAPGTGHPLTFTRGEVRLVKTVGDLHDDLDGRPRPRGTGRDIEAREVEPEPPVPRSSPPYPHSRVIESITWHWETLATAAPGSDLWPVAWGPDDHLYAAWGDGGGFGGSNSDGRVAMGFARIEGTPEHWRGFNVNGGKNPEHPASFPQQGKTTGIAVVDGVLYATVNLQDGAWPNVNHALVWSTNQGANWTRADWLFPKGEGRFQPAKFLTFGRDYTGVPAMLAGYVYLCGPRQSTDRGSGNRLYLARAPRTRLRERNAYQFFQRVDEAGAPVWITEEAQAQPIFADDQGVTPGSVVYVPALKRFLLACFHVGPGQLGVFDAPDPWGPWTTVAYDEDWGGMGPQGEGLTCGFPQKWMSGDGLTLWGVFSVYGDGAKQGINAHDRFNLVKATLQLGRPAWMQATPAWTDISSRLLERLTNSGTKLAWPGGCSGVVVNRRNGQVTIKVVGGGLWRSADLGKAWERIDQETISGRDETGWATSADPNAPERMASFSLDGTAGWTSDGRTWKRFTSLGRNWDFGSVDWAATAPRTIIAAKHETSPPGEVYVTTDGGETWKKLSIHVGYNRDRISMVGALDRTTLIYSQGEGIQRSTDTGMTWTRVSTANPQTRIPVLFRGAHYLGTATGLLVSQDQGASWRSQGAEVNIWQGPYFGHDEKEMAVVGKAGVFITTNAGQTWTKAADLKPQAGGFVFSPNWFGCYAWDPVHHILYASAMGNPVYATFTAP